MSLVHGPLVQVARSLSKRSSNDECEGVHQNDVGIKLKTGITSQQTLEYISAAALGLTVILGVGLITTHLARYTVPREQRQIVRIIFFPIFFAIMAFLSVAFYDTAIYLRPVASIYEGICLPCLLILYFHYVCPVEQSLWDFFSHVQLTDRDGVPLHKDTESWAKRVWVCVFQFPFTMTAAAIIEIATQAGHVFCAGSLRPRHAHLWVQIIEIIALVIAVPNVILFEIRMKKYIDPRHRSAAKLWSFKGLVILQFIQQIIFGLLNNHVFNPTATLTYNDLYYGIPNTITCIESMLFALAFWWSYSASEYHPDVVKTQGHKMAFWRAIFDSLNIADLLAGVATMFKLLVTGNFLGSEEGGQAYLSPYKQDTAYEGSQQMHQNGGEKPYPDAHVART